ncbi:hypothetical protein OAO87_00045, partial [bacterium]|nr:hypothetical protein [bacterium]
MSPVARCHQQEVTVLRLGSLFRMLPMLRWLDEEGKAEARTPTPVHLPLPSPSMSRPDRLRPTARQVEHLPPVLRC